MRRLLLSLVTASALHAEFPADLERLCDAGKDVPLTRGSIMFGETHATGFLFTRMGEHDYALVGVPQASLGTTVITPYETVATLPVHVLVRAPSGTFGDMGPMQLGAYTREMWRTTAVVDDCERTMARLAVKEGAWDAGEWAEATRCVDALAYTGPPVLATCVRDPDEGTLDWQLIKVDAVRRTPLGDGYMVMGYFGHALLTDAGARWDALYGAPLFDYATTPPTCVGFVQDVRMHDGEWRVMIAPAEYVLESVEQSVWDANARP